MIEKQRLILAAMDFAEEKHRGQERKYTGEPYIIHPRNVALLVSTVAHNHGKRAKDMICAAHLHDVVEDCNVSLGHIIQSFGAHVGAALYYLTDPPNPSREERHEIAVHKLLTAPPWVKEVRAADIIDNTKDIIEKAPAFAPIYLREKLDLMRRCYLSDNTLGNRAWRQVISLYESIR